MADVTAKADMLHLLQRGKIHLTPLTPAGIAIGRLEPILTDLTVSQFDLFATEAIANSAHCCRLSNSNGFSLPTE